jgi:hypothetical protein
MLDYQPVTIPTGYPNIIGVNSRQCPTADINARRNGPSTVIAKL